MADKFRQMGERGDIDAGKVQDGTKAPHATALVPGIRVVLAVLPAQAADGRGKRRHDGTPGASP